MTRRSPSASRLAALLSAAVLVGAGFTGAAAHSAGVSDAATCDASSRATKDAGLGVTHTYAKSVTQTAGAGATVTYTIDVGTTGIGNPYVQSVTDIPPAGFAKPTAKATVYFAIGGRKTVEVPVTAAGSGWQVSTTGWFVNASNPATVKFTYPMPTFSIPGQTVTSGGIEVTGTVGVGNKLPGLTACFLTRVISPGEAIGSVGADLSSSGSTESIIENTVSSIIKGILGGIGGGIGS
ncbi:hypothetical protein nbrc107696_24150 [Gordonia spumicola]|uniref:Cyclase n=1 Tax=Gordonia spumicola TaxID=589161 RepID=A0A7I9V9H6_9ACTN|nr:hypothetical protein [Gordonia spumicola]GEE01969.1 hypothetical protein nbrc107696_24150 [Gordonia spumicola]